MEEHAVTVSGTAASPDWRSALIRRWIRWRDLLLIVTIVLMLVGAAQRLTDGFVTLLWRNSRPFVHAVAQPQEHAARGTADRGDAQVAAIDLLFRHREVRGWFAGTPIYVTEPQAVYPPATYVGLWPLVGWPRVGAVRWLWAVTSTCGLVWLVYLTVYGSGARSRLERTFLALLPLSIYATRATLVNGQLILHTLPPLLAGLLLLHERPRRWGSDVTAAALVLAGSLKPSLAIPFGWLVLIGPGSIRPALLIVTGYAGLTLLADLFQPQNTIALIQMWIAKSTSISTAVTGSQHANIHTWLTGIGLRGWGRSGSLLIVGLLGAWTYRHRRADIWVQFGVAALVTRFWVAHSRYDDVLMLVPMVALYRLTRLDPSRVGAVLIAGVLLGANCAVMLAPARLIFAGPIWADLFETTQTVVWLATLVFLSVSAASARHHDLPSSP